MIFEYYGKKFQGTRDEILKQLREYLDSCELTQSNDRWRLANKKIRDVCGPIRARCILTDNIINHVHFEFHGTTFEDIGDLEQYLRGLHLIHEGSGSFTLGGYCRHFKKHSVGYIRELMIKEIINGI